MSITGEQNSSKAGFTNVMYCVSTASKSRPRSLMSRGTEFVENIYGILVKYMFKEILPNTHLFAPIAYLNLYPQRVSYERDRVF